MRVILAGYNVDTQILREAIEAGIPKERLTPEVLSAAYARISRDPRPVGELRQIALQEVEKARSSNRKIIFEMGHHSVAEHAVFNFDVLGISRLAIEWLERFRLCSYTEKSQRYITLDHDFTIPPEVKGTPLESELLSLIQAQADCYDKLNKALRERLSKSHADKGKKRFGRQLLDSWAKEDARYVTILATTGQLGLTANARNLELMTRRFAASPLKEVQELGKHLYEAGRSVAPSLLLFTEPSPYDSETVVELAELAQGIRNEDAASRDSSEPVRLVNHSRAADRTVAAALLYVCTAKSYESCLGAVGAMTEEELSRVFFTAMQHMEFFDAAPREFEHVSLTFEVVLSSSAFAQLKRHRMSTQSVQHYDPSLGVTVPPSIVEAGLEDEFFKQIRRAEKLYEKILNESPHAAPYVLTNAHRRRVLVTTNLRELYHLIRLREDFHAQWDIRAIAARMREEASLVMPLGCSLLCGKDSFQKKYAEVYGRNPTVLPPEE
jgi:flavin-dependent thymidylate synthase